MTDGSRRVFERLYSNAVRPEDLPWHRDEPPALLTRALAQRRGVGSALDLGCGAGTYSLFMARRGYRVTAVDFMPQAVKMLSEQAAAAGLDIEAVQADIMTWTPPRAFDVVLDVGCLHSLRAAQRAAYATLLQKALGPGGDYILTHCGRRGWWDRWPIGPERLTDAEVLDLLGPHLRLRAYEPEIMRNMPLFMGRSALVGRYWLQKTG